VIEARCQHAKLAPSALVAENSAARSAAPIDQALSHTAQYAPTGYPLLSSLSRELRSKPCCGRITAQIGHMDSNGIHSTRVLIGFIGESHCKRRVKDSA
jgi:hypothetical protein